MGTPHLLIQGSFGPLDLVAHDIIVNWTALVLFFFVLSLCHMSVQPNLIALFGGVSNALGFVSCTSIFDIFGTWPYFVPAPNFVC